MKLAFDRIDEKFRAKEPIKLECTVCGSTKQVECGVNSEGEKEPICRRCLGWVGL